MDAATPAARHRAVAAVFTERVRGTRDWSAPAPVEGWVARDVVEHLTTWFPAFLESCGAPRPAGPSAAEDPVAAWEAQTAAVQALLDDPARADAPVDNPHIGAMSLGSATDMIYTTDVFLHTWDLARATGQDDRLDEQTCADLLAGMLGMEEAIRSSGQYGPPVPVPEDADARTRMLGFIGRDPGWRPPAG